MYKRALVIINPRAGTQKARKNMYNVVERLCNAGYSITTQITAGPKDATKMVCELGKPHDLILCCGGDGTLNETINGILQAGLTTPLGYLPTGTTNDFARTLKLPKKIDKCMDRILEGFPRNCDVGSFNERRFTYIASLGAFTKVSHSTPQKLKNILGHTAYLLEGAKEVFSVAPFKATVQADEKTYEGEFVFGAITNSTSVAGLFRLDQLDVRLDDGEFEMILVRNPKNSIELTRIVQSIVSGHYDPKYIIFNHCKKVTVQTEKPMEWTLDGEASGLLTDVEINVCPKAIRLFY